MTENKKVNRRKENDKERKTKEGEREYMVNDSRETRDL